MPWWFLEAGELRMSSLVVRRLLHRPSIVRRLFVSERTITTTETGAILPKPPKPYSFGLLRVAIVTGAFTYCGAMIAKNFADYLETENIFVPDDDDD